MTVKNSVQEVKTALAKLLATENLTVQYAYVPTASFDVKNRVLTLPIFKDISVDETDLFVGHEVAHALFTPCEGMENLPIKTKNFHSFVNVTEDARIERLIQAKYPGLKKVFYNAYGELSAKDFFQLSKLGDVNNMLFIDRLNLKAKLGQRFDCEFTEEEEAFYNRAMTTTTFDEAVSLAEEIYAYCQKEMEEKSQDKEEEELYKSAEQNEDMQTEEDGEQEVVTQQRNVDWSDQGSDEAEKRTEDSASQSEENEDAKEEETAEETSEDTAEDDAETNAAVTEASPEGGPQSMTDIASQASMKEMVEDNLENVVAYLDIPKSIKIEKFVVPFKRVHEEILEYWTLDTRRDRLLAENALNFKKKNQKVINYLHKEFEMKKAAQSYSKSFESKTGVLNTQRLYSYKFTEDIFKKATSTPTGKSHGMVFFLDWSGSMADNLKGTMEQLINLALFCKKSNIPFNAYAFTSEYAKHDLKGPKSEFQSTNLWEAVLGGCSLLELFNHKMNTRQFNRAVEIWLAVSTMFDRRSRGDFGYWGLPRKYYLSGTPLNEAIILATKIVPEFQKSANIQIVNACFLSDGSSHSLEGRFDIDKLNRNHDQYIDMSYQVANKLYIRDKKTASLVEINSVKYNRDGNRITKALYMMLKKMTGCNLVGFFIAENREVNYAFHQFYKDPMVEFDHPWNANAAETEFKKLLTKEKAVVAYHSGMDELYIIKGGKALEINDEGLESVAKTASKAQITTAFKKMTRGKLQNRVVLQKFIEQIAA